VPFWIEVRADLFEQACELLWLNRKHNQIGAMHRLDIRGEYGEPITRQRGDLADLAPRNSHLRRLESACEDPALRERRSKISTA
jgi:hypothetical protein